MSDEIDRVTRALDALEEAYRELKNTDRGDLAHRVFDDTLHHIHHKVLFAVALSGDGPGAVKLAQAIRGAERAYALDFPRRLP